MLLLRREGGRLVTSLDVAVEDRPKQQRAKRLRRLPLAQGKRRCVGGLAELKIEAPAPAAAFGDVGWMIENYVGLVQAEFVAENVVGAEKIDAADRGVEVVVVVAVERDVDSGVAEEAEDFGVGGFKGGRRGIGSEGLGWRWYRDF